jgi:hypothetical protein
MATDIKDVYPAKHVVLVHSRLQLLNRFHEGLHKIAAKQCEELGIELVLGDRAIIPKEGFPIEEGAFDVELQSGKTLPADFAVRAMRGVLSTLNEKHTIRSYPSDKHPNPRLYPHCPRAR